MTNLFEQLLGRPLFCRYCGKRCEGDFRTEAEAVGEVSRLLGDDLSEAECRHEPDKVGHEEHPAH